ncbi:choice-of-anchor J domain-containing protein [Psychroserpens sp. AS72]|uniref:T9SS-dependent choice-of-anchor J family protein n=1 Tax=Psychroserpens sp. AS72 TaxID=3135775 RepID=UPI0031711BAB
MNKIDTTINESMDSISVIENYILINKNNYFNFKPSRVLKQIILLFILFFALTSINAQPIKAFPTAAGAGAYATGGRGGTVYHVTNLNNSGTGSLRDATSSSNRIIVFDVSGTIELTSTLVITSDNLTIAGQTAPLGGITVTGKTVNFSNADNIIVRYIRFRPDYTSDIVDALNANNFTNSIVDHCSISWGGDECFSQTGTSSNITVQNCILAESATGMLAGGSNTTSNNFSIINNLWYNISHRTPNIAADRTDVINNVVHNWFTRLMVVSTKDNTKLNEIGNYYQSGAKTANPVSPNWSVNWLDIGSASQRDNIRIYTDGNVYPSFLTEAQDDWKLYRYRGNITSGAYAGTSQWDLASTDFRVTTPFTLLGEAPNITTAAEALSTVPLNAGANKYLNADGSFGTFRDNLDSNYVSDVTNNTSAWYAYPPTDLVNKQHYVDFHNSVSNTPINIRPAGFDTNNDGIPNIWGNSNLPNGATATTIAPSGYTWIEEYINGLTATNNTTIGVDDNKQTQENTPVNGNVITNDNDPQGDNQTVASALVDKDGDGVSDDSLPLGNSTSIYGTSDTGVTGFAGTITLSNTGTYAYSPASNFTGTVEIPYIVTDDNASPATDNATLYLTVLQNITTGCSGEITSFPYVEGFENTLGAWTQSSTDDIDWTVDENETPSSGTGPSSASQGAYYIFLEASGTGTGYPTKQAVLNSPCFNLTGLSEANFSFKYHQYGSSDMGSVDLELSVDNGVNWTSIWNSVGNKGNTWLLADVDISAYVGGSVKLRFNRVTGGTWEADVAIDDVNLSGVNSIEEVCSGTITSFPYAEGFENTLGDWTQSSFDDIDWTVDANGTVSGGTGPSNASQGSYYLYVEASNFLNKQAILNSPCFDLSALTDATFSFKYHQFGSSDMGSINLEASDDDGLSWTSIWNSSGNIGDSWLTANIDMSSYVGGNVQLRFNRIIGNTWQADFAIDDVSMLGGDLEAPVISLIGASTLTLNLGDTYNELGATATDNVDGNISGNISVGGATVNSNAVGTYVVTYNVSDAAGNDAIQVVRTVNVINLSSECSGEITSYPYTEGFENTLGAWTQSSLDDINWTVDDSGTISGGTGPSSAVQGTYYIYVEASESGVGFPTKQAILNSPCFNLSGLSEANFSFKYHQFGSENMGSIDLEASDDDGESWTSIWNSEGNKGDTWLTANVDLGVFIGGSVQLRFNRVTGSTWQADLAIDDVNLSVQNGGGVDCSGAITSYPYAEGFENTLGAWTQSSADDIDWTIDANGTVSGGTGPSSASQGTYYLYVEASNYLNKQAILNSPCFDLSALTDATFSFKYHQFGSENMGSIDLEASNDNGASWTSIWNSNGNLGDEWFSANVDISSYVGASVQLRFNRVTGSTWQADFAIDDINIKENGNSGGNGCSRGISSYPYTQGFENTLGDWTQSLADDIDWTINANGTVSGGTGPSSAIQGLYYLYVEASETNIGYPTKQAILNSPCFNLSAQASATFSFNYHEYGASDMGTIDLEVSDDDGLTWVSIWNSSGNLGDSWQTANVDLSSFIGGGVQLRFNRITGNTWQADFAIDNVNLSTGTARVEASSIVLKDESEIILYPNPVKDNILNIKSTYTNISYEIYNMVGQLVSKGHVKNKAIDVSNLKGAIYQITFSAEGEIITKQFIKQ